MAEKLRLVTDLAFNDDQPRHPKGTPGGKGGQWKDTYSLQASAYAKGLDYAGLEFKAEKFKVVSVTDNLTGEVEDLGPKKGQPIEDIHSVPIGTVVVDADGKRWTKGGETSFYQQAAEGGGIEWPSYGPDALAGIDGDKKVLLDTLGDGTVPEWIKRDLAKSAAKAAAMSPEQTEANILAFDSAMQGPRTHPYETFENAPIGTLFQPLPHVLTPNDDAPALHKVAPNQWRQVVLNENGSVFKTDTFGGLNNNGMTDKPGTFIGWAQPQAKDEATAIPIKEKIDKILASPKGGDQIEISANPEAPPRVYVYVTHNGQWLDTMAGDVWASNDKMTKAVAAWFDKHEFKDWSGIAGYHVADMHKTRVSEPDAPYDEEDVALSNVSRDPKFPNLSGEQLAPIPSRSLYEDNPYVVSRVNAYTGEWASFVNKALVEEDWASLDDMQSEIEDMDAAFSPAREDFVVWRVFKPKHFGGRVYADDFVRDRDELIGQEFHGDDNPAYMSTTLDAGYAQSGRLVMRLHVPKGTPIVNADNPDGSPEHYEAEREIILGRGLSIKVTGVKKIKQPNGRPITVVEVEVIGSGQHYPNLDERAIALNDAANEAKARMNAVRSADLMRRWEELPDGEYIGTVPNVGQLATVWQKRGDSLYQISRPEGEPLKGRWSVDVTFGPEKGLLYMPVESKAAQDAQQAAASPAPFEVVKLAAPKLPKNPTLGHLLAKGWPGQPGYPKPHDGVNIARQWADILEDASDKAVVSEVIGSTDYKVHWARVEGGWEYRGDDPAWRAIALNEGGRRNFGSAIVAGWMAVYSHNGNSIGVETE